MQIAFLYLSDLVTLASMDGWMISDFISFSTVFQLYQDDGRMTIKVCVQWNPVYG